MKKLFTIVMFLFYVAGYSAPWLGFTRTELISAISGSNLIYQKDGVADDGSPYVMAFTEDGDVAYWYFSEGTVFQYHLIIDNDDLNTYVSILNKKFVKEEEWQWSDYSYGIRWYYHILRSGEYYVLVVSYNDIKP